MLTMFPLIGSLVGAGANLLSGFMGQQNQADINRQNIQAQEFINQQNINEQEQFAKSGIQWRVADAKAAGINPLAALGAQTASFSNLVAPKSESSNAAGTGLAAAGQDLSRAISATRTAEDAAVATEKTRLDLESSQLDNDLKRASLASSIARTTGAHVGPPMSRSGTDELHTVSGPSGPMTGPSRATEGWAWLDPVAKEQYFVRNQLMPWLGYNIPAEEQKRAGSGAVLAKNPFTGSFYDTRQFRYDGPLSWAHDWMKRELERR